MKNEKKYTPKPAVRACDSCIHFVFDEDYADYACEVALDEDEMLSPAIECVIEAGIASTSLLQRKLKLGYARAARIIDELEARGIIGPFEGSKPRSVLISKERWLEMKVNQMDNE